MPLAKLEESHLLLSVETFKNNWFLLNVVHPFTPEQMENYAVRAVTVHRTTIKKDMIELFQDSDILSSVLMFTFVGFNGLPEKGEGVGVARDVLTSFWQQFFDSLAVGVQEKVPAIRHDHQKMQWLTIVRILIYG